MSYNTLGQLIERTVEFATGHKLRDNWNYDKLGRPTSQSISINNRESSHRKYTWDSDSGDKIKSIIDTITGQGREYSYSKQGYPEVETIKRVGNVIRAFDNTGKVYNTKSRIDRDYKKGGQLVRLNRNTYEYNECGDLTKKTEKDGKTWHYIYTTGGLMDKVIRPDGKEVSFTYDPLGRRISKSYNGNTTRYEIGRASCRERVFQPV
jgi:YD repeat-containing protein